MLLGFIVSNSFESTSSTLINLDLTVDIYYGKKNVSGSHRIAYSQFRLSGHELAIESNRWNRRGCGRLPVACTETH